MDHSKNHHLTIRMSAEEYAGVTRACSELGYRTLSQFIRSAVLDKVRSVTSDKAFVFDDLNNLVCDLDALDENLRNLSSRIERLLGPKENHT